jgi:alpha-methylacyl-CoA racemase
MLPLSPLFGSGRGKNKLDGGAPFYDVYVCKGGGFMSVGCLEPQFFREFIRLFVDALPRQFNIGKGWIPMSSTYRVRDEWPNLKEFLEKGFMTNTRDYWANVFHGATPIFIQVVCVTQIVGLCITGSDACALPVLTPIEAHASALPDASFLTVHTASQPVTALSNPCLQPGTHTQEILEELGLSEGERRQLVLNGALGEEARIHLHPAKL